MERLWGAVVNGDGASGSSPDPDVVPPEVIRFHESIPVFRMLEFSMFPEERLTMQEWRSRQEEMLSADPASVSVRALTDLPDAEMLSFDLTERDEGYPLSVSELGAPEGAEPLDLTIAEYLDLATELAPLEAQMFSGVYPYEAIVAAVEDRGLRSNDYWSDYLGVLAESRAGTEERMRYLRENPQ